jgi:hypothetical protein
MARECPNNGKGNPKGQLGTGSKATSKVCGASSPSLCVVDDSNAPSANMKDNEALPIHMHIYEELQSLSGKPFTLHAFPWFDTVPLVPVNEA